MNPGSAPLFVLLYLLFIFLEALMICALNHRNPNRKKEIYLKDILPGMYFFGTFILPVIIPVLVIPAYIYRLNKQIDGQAI